METTSTTARPAFQKEIAVGLFALALLTLGITGAAVWTLRSVSSTLEDRSRAELSALALDISVSIENGQTPISNGLQLPHLATVEKSISACIFKHTGKQIYSLACAYGQAGKQDAELHTILEKRMQLEPRLRYAFDYFRTDNSESDVYLAPIFLDGEWLTLGIIAESPTLASLEKTTEYFLYTGAIASALLLTALIALYFAALRPYNRIRTSIAGVIDSTVDAERGVDEVIDRYRETIRALEEKEESLLELNAMLTDRVSEMRRLNEYLLSSISTGVVLLDNRGNVIGVNELARTLLHYTGPANSLNPDKPIEDYVGLFQSIPELKIAVEHRLAKGSAREFECDYRDEKGESLRLRVSCIPLKNERGELQELALFISDQTELMLARQRLEDSRRLATLGEMSAGLAHQLRNSISAAIGFGSLAQRRAVGNQGTQEPISALLKELQNEAALIDRFLSYSKPLTPVYDTVNLKSFLDDSVASLGVDDKSAKRIMINIDPKLSIDADALLLKQVMINIIDNALKASAATGGKVQVDAERISTGIRVSVSDNGPGIPESDREKIFTPFYSSSPSGVGLGLPLARKIVQLHGGTIRVGDSRSGGARFFIEIPLERPERRQKPESTLSDSSPLRA